MGRKKLVEREYPIFGHVFLNSMERKRLVWAKPSILSETFVIMMEREKFVEWEYPIYGHALRISDGVSKNICKCSSI